MTPCPHTIGAAQSAEAAQEKMKEHHIRHLPVRKGGQLVGILSDRDITYAMAMDHKELKDLKVEDIFYPDPYCVSQEAPLKEVAAQMARNAYGSALVLNDIEELVGIFTTVDACKLLAESC